MTAPDPNATEPLEYVLISDVHLNELSEPPRPGWWEYKGLASAQDAELVAFMAALEAQRPAYFARTVLIMNGDTFDFDTCFSGPDGTTLPPEGLPPTVAGSIHKMGRILADHAPFVAGLARFLSRGNRAIFVMGNHDRELHFAPVQDLLRDLVARAAPPGASAAVAAAIAFEPWFVYAPGVLYAEHGNQYDATCSYRDVLDPSVPPTGRHGLELETPFGSLLGRHTLCRLGTFNPYNDESFILSLGGYVAHWRRFYFPRRPFFTAYVAAAWRGLRELRGRRTRQLRGRPPRPAPDDPPYQAYRDAKGVDAAFIARQLRLSSVPIADRAGLLYHEMWLDRFLLMFAALAIFVVGAALARTWTHAALLLALLPVLLFVFRTMGRGSLALQERARWGLVAESIAEALTVPVVAFGHSHRPERRPLTQGGRYYNLGSWAPVLPSDRGSTLARARRYLVVRADANRRVHVAFARWGDDGDGARGNPGERPGGRPEGMATRLGPGDPTGVSRPGDTE